MTFSHLDLNYPGSLLIEGVGHVRCPTAGEIVKLREASHGARSGEELYNLYLDVFIRTKAQFLEAISTNFDEAQLKELDEVPLLLLYLAFRETRELLLNAVDYFFDEDAVLDSESTSVLLVKKIDNHGVDDYEIIGSITAENFNDVKNLILQRNYITPPANPNGKRRSKKMMEHDAKIEKGRKQSTKFKQNQIAMQLGNIVSKVASGSALSISSVYEMTVYQIYDYFFELNTSVQINAALTRWCVWGRDKFDFSQWYKVTNEK